MYVVIVVKGHEGHIDASGNFPQNVDATHHLYSNQINEIIWG